MPSIYPPRCQNLGRWHNAHSCQLGRSLHLQSRVGPAYLSNPSYTILLVSMLQPNWTGPYSFKTLCFPGWLAAWSTFPLTSKCTDPSRGHPFYEDFPKLFGQTLLLLWNRLPHQNFVASFTFRLLANSFTAGFRRKLTLGQVCCMHYLIYSPQSQWSLFRDKEMRHSDVK